MGEGKKEGEMEKSCQGALQQADSQAAGEHSVLLPEALTEATMSCSSGSHSPFLSAPELSCVTWQRMCIK